MQILGKLEDYLAKSKPIRADTGVSERKGREEEWGMYSLNNPMLLAAFRVIQ